VAEFFDLFDTELLGDIITALSALCDFYERTNVESLTKVLFGYY
jgi:hypothetical protein